MEPVRPRVRLWSLVREELRALPRNSFALGAVAVVLALLVPVAGFGLVGRNAMRELLVFGWLVAELAVAVVVAARVAGARRSRFVDSLYTTPLEQRTWILAQGIVGAVLAVLVLVPQMPFVLLHFAHVGAPPVFAALVAAAVGMAAFAVALGLFCGVVVGEAGTGAAAGLAGGLGFVAFLLFLLHGAAVTMPPSPLQPILARLTALSPLALATDAAGVTLFRVTPDDPWRPTIGLVALVGGLAGAAWTAYTSSQGPLGWERSAGRAFVVALVAGTLVVPVVTAETSFREVAVQPNYVFSPGERVHVAFVPRGAAITEAEFTMRAFFDREPVHLGERTELDALVLLVVPEGADVGSVSIDVRGDGDLRVVAGGQFRSVDAVPAGFARPTTASVGVGAAMPVFRVPITVEAIDGDALRGSSAVATADVSFVADGRAYASRAQVSIWIDVPGATTQLLLAGLPLPLAAFGAVVVRRRRTG